MLQAALWLSAMKTIHVWYRAGRVNEAGILNLLSCLSSTVLVLVRVVQQLDLHCPTPLFFCSPSPPAYEMRSVLMPSGSVDVQLPCLSLMSLQTKTCSRTRFYRERQREREIEQSSLLRLGLFFNLVLETLCVCVCLKMTSLQGLGSFFSFLHLWRIATMSDL